MSTPYELPVAPVALTDTAVDVEALLSRTPLRIVPDPDALTTPVDFDAFVRKQTPRLRRLIMRKLGDPGEAEEIAQETFLRAHQHLHTLGTEDELVAWTTVVGQRLAIDRLRVRGRSIAVAEVPEDSRVGRDTADIVVARAEARTALEALEAIPERQAAILWAREVEGLHYDAIAERFAISEPAVRSLLHRGRRALRKEYAVRGGTLPLRSLVPLAPGLIALRGLNRLRTAARQAVKGNVSAFATMSVAGALALGMTVGGGLGTLDRRAPSTALGPDQITQQTFNEPVTPSGAVRAADRALNPSTYDAGPGRVGTAATLLQTAVPTACSTATGKRTCVGSKQARGDMLYIGPALPENPTGVERVSVGSNYVGFCDVTPQTPLTECSRGQTRYRVPEAIPLPPVDVPSIGAQK
ncbi:MAG TPA: RNA polymerase sigma factor [Mycobacteriales bacterium]|nr:RNA polymerase sigma factor [Mycobacteriales bacterium]